jgi:hypothetical protein
MPRWLGVLLGLGIGSLAGCLLEVDAGPSCGDGFVDRARGEECDFALQDELPPGQSCDPDACVLYRCGNGELEPGEACEGTQARALPPCQAWTCAACQVVCPRCGNGLVDAGEECDFEFEVISTTPTQCDSISVPGRPGDFYEPGGNPVCRADCRWDRSTCSLCGNGELDDQIIDPNTGSLIIAAERCDGEKFDLADRFDRCEAACGEPGRDCKATCGEGCFDIRVDPTDAACCVRPGHPRSSVVPCCCELPEGELPPYCSDVFDPSLGTPTCPG